MGFFIGPLWHQTEELTPVERTVIVRHMEGLERLDRREKKLVKAGEVAWSVAMFIAGLVLGICLCSGGGR